LLRFFGGLLQGFGCPSPLPRGMAQPVDHARGDKDHNAYNDLKERQRSRYSLKAIISK
jgi:hypothetical protein